MGFGGAILQILYHIVRFLCHKFQTVIHHFNGKFAYLQRVLKHVCMFCTCTEIQHVLNWVSCVKLHYFTYIIPLVLYMRNDLMSASKAGNTWKALQNDKFKIDSKGTELLLTMTHTAMTVQVIWPGNVHKSKQIGIIWREILYLPTCQKVLRIHPYNFAQLIYWYRRWCWCASLVWIRKIATELQMNSFV